MTTIGQLLISLFKAHRAAIAGSLSDIGMYPGQDGLLYHLSQNDGLTMTELAEKLKIKPPTLFTMVSRMEAAGLVKKDKDKSDKRTSRIFLTAKGRKQLSVLSRIWQDTEKQLSKGFSTEEMDTARTVLGRLIKNLGEDEVVPAEKSI